LSSRSELTGKISPGKCVNYFCKLIVSDLDLPRSSRFRNGSRDPNHFVREINQLRVLCQFLQLAAWPDSGEQSQRKVTNQFTAFKLRDVVQERACAFQV
jgi:hypothetical protein